MFRHLYKVLFCVCGSFMLSYSKESTSFGECFVPNELSNKTAWKLVWQDDFEWDNITASEWDVQHEAIVCSGNGIRQVSCNTKQNLLKINGMLVLKAQFEKYYQYSYTAATITSKRFFRHGRWEIRMAQPVGKQIRSSIFTRNDNETYWHEFGQIDIASNMQEPIVHRGVHYANSSSYYQSGFDHIIVDDVDLHDFHRYGIIWDDKTLRFFFDDILSESILFDNVSKRMTTLHNIRLQIGVGGQLFAKSMPEIFEKLKWECPALIVDYVRIYEKISVEEANFMKQCIWNETSSSDSKIIIENICERAMLKLIRGWSLSRVHWLSIIIVLVLALFFSLLLYLVIQVRKVKRKVKQDSIPLDHYTQTNDYYDSIYERVNVYETDLRKDTEDCYEPNLPIGNEYLEVKDGYYQRDKSENDSNNYDVLSSSKIETTNAYEGMNKS